MHIPLRSASALAVAGALAVGGVAAAAAAPAATNGSQPATATPIQHVVVIFQENVSFDHYFATYPQAANTSGSSFHAKPGTPSVNGLSGALLTHNPNQYNLQRLSPAQAVTCDQDHAYTAEQKAFDQGLMDKFVQYTGYEAVHPEPGDRPAGARLTALGLPQDRCRGRARQVPGTSSGAPGARSSASAAAADHSHEAAVAGAPIPGHSSVARPCCSWPPPDAGGRAATCPSWEGAVQARVFLARATYRVTLATAPVAARASHSPGTV